MFHGYYYFAGFLILKANVLKTYVLKTCFSQVLAFDRRRTKRIGAS